MSAHSGVIIEVVRLVVITPKEAHGQGGGQRRQVVNIGLHIAAIDHEGVTAAIEVARVLLGGQLQSDGLSLE